MTKQQLSHSFIDIYSADFHGHPTSKMDLSKHVIFTFSHASNHMDLKNYSSILRDLQFEDLQHQSTRAVATGNTLAGI